MNRKLDRFCALHHINALAFKIIVPLVLIVFIGSVGINIKLIVQSRNISSKTTDLGFKNIGELSTQAGFYTNVQVIDKSQKLFGWSLPLTQSKSIFSYDGVIKAGYNFSKITIDVDDTVHTIIVKLPQPEIFSNEIDPDSMQIYDERQSIFTPLKINDMNDSLVELKKESKEKAISNGLLDNVRKNAELLITGFLSSAYDPNQYSIKFK